MGHKLAVDELDLDEATLPLADLSGIRRRRRAAARVAASRRDHRQPAVPRRSQHLRALLGDDYVEWLKREFDVGVKDYCVYWFRKAHDQLEPGGRAGLVGTNSISQNRARGASLELHRRERRRDHVGGFDAGLAGRGRRRRQHRQLGERANLSAGSCCLGWPGGGARYRRRCVRARLWSPSGSLKTPVSPTKGCSLGRITSSSTTLLNVCALPDPPYARVVRPYLSGDDIANDPLQRPSRYIVDFGVMPLEAAMAFPDALEIVRRQAKEDRERSRSYSRNPRWWQFLWPRPVFRERLAAKKHFIAGTATGKRILFCWCDVDVIASNSTNVFALDAEFHFGVLTSRIHTEWARARSSTLEDRIRYTPTSAFGTFPWPAPVGAAADAVAQAARELLIRRRAVCIERQIGLTEPAGRTSTTADTGIWWSCTRRLTRLLQLRTDGRPRRRMTLTSRVTFSSNSTARSLPARPSTDHPLTPRPTIETLRRSIPAASIMPQDPALAPR